ncbi:MAG: tetratricopeptide repeat protein [Sphingobium sp.]
MKRSILIAGIGTLWLVALGTGQYIHSIAPKSEVEQADAAVRLAAAQDDRLGFEAALKRLQQLSPPMAALRRYENIGKPILPVPEEKEAEAKAAARSIAMQSPETRAEASRQYAFDLTTRPETAAEGLAMLQNMTGSGDTSATAMLAESLETINTRRAEVGPLWRSIAFRRSAAALQTAEFLGFQPKLTLSSYEANDYKRIAERLMRREAADGNTASMVSLGDLLRRRGTPADVVQARELYERASAAGSVRAMVRLGEVLLGPGFNKNDAARAYQLLQQAAARKSSEASYIMAENYRRGRGAPIDNRRAYRYYLLAAAGGSAGAQVRLGDFEAAGINGPANPQRAFQWYERAAAAGSATAFVKLAQAYLPGGTLPQNNAKAVDYLTEAAKRGNVMAMSRLTEIYRQGQIVDRDLDLSNEWALRAVNAGSKDNNLLIVAAQALVAGGTTPAELKRGQDLLMQAIRGGSVEARTKLGGLLLSLGESEAGRQAMSLFKEAAATGNGEALASLASIYASGNGVPVDAELSFQYYKLAAARGTASGFRGMGVAYATGFGVEKNAPLALAAYQRGAALGDIRATILLAGCYVDGCGTTPQPAKGHALIAGIFGRGNNDVDYDVAMLMMKGELPGSNAKALEILTKAAQRGHGPSRVTLRRLGQFDPREQQKVDQQRRETILLAGTQG